LERVFRAKSNRKTADLSFERQRNSQNIKAKEIE